MVNRVVPDPVSIFLTGGSIEVAPYPHGLTRRHGIIDVLFLRGVKAHQGLDGLDQVSARRQEMSKQGQVGPG